MTSKLRTLGFGNSPTARERSFIAKIDPKQFHPRSAGRIFTVLNAPVFHSQAFGGSTIGAPISKVCGDDHLHASHTTVWHCASVHPAQDSTVAVVVVRRCQRASEALQTERGRWCVHAVPRPHRWWLMSYIFSTCLTVIYVVYVGRLPTPNSA